MGIELTTPVAALFAGLATSLHCVGMCGPLACTFCARGGGGATGGGRMKALGVYHFGRVVSYGVLGGLAGLFGAAVAPVFAVGPGRYLPWAFVAFFLALAFGLDKRLRIRGGRTILPPAWFRKVAALPGTQLGAITGLLTPLLPCGPLYMVLAVVVFSGSVAKGAGMMAAFALGTIPLLFLVQGQFALLQGRVSPRSLAWIQRSFACISALLIVWRLSAGAEFNPADPAGTSCCH